MSYSISKAYALSGSQGDSRVATKWYIIAHDTGNDNNKGAGSAKNEASYMKGHWSAAYTHFIVDDTGIYQVGEPGYVAWGALDANPYSPMQVELAHVNSQARFNESYKRYIWLLRTYANKYGIPLTLDTGGAGTKGIKTHQWVTNHYGGDHVDPYGYLAKWGISKAQFAKDLKNGVGGVPKPKKGTYMSWRPHWIYTLKAVQAYKLSSQVGTGKNVVKSYSKGSRLETKAQDGHRFQLLNGTWVTANEDYVRNLYYTPTGGVKVVKSVNGTNRYKDLALTKKVDGFKKGTEFSVKKVVKYGHGSRILLDNGLYISGSKLINSFVE